MVSYYSKGYEFHFYKKLKNWNLYQTACAVVLMTYRREFLAVLRSRHSLLWTRHLRKHKMYPRHFLLPLVQGISGERMPTSAVIQDYYSHFSFDYVNRLLRMISDSNKLSFYVCGTTGREDAGQRINTNSV